MFRQGERGEAECNPCNSYISIKPHRGGTKLLKFKVSPLTGFTSSVMPIHRGCALLHPCLKYVSPTGLMVSPSSRSCCYQPITQSLIVRLPFFLPDTNDIFQDTSKIQAHFACMISKATSLTWTIIANKKYNKYKTLISQWVVFVVFISMLHTKGINIFNFLTSSVQV